MSWSAALADLNAAVVSDAVGFGEPITLPTATVQAVVDLSGIAGEVRARGSDTGARLGVGQQALPAITLLEADAAGLREQDQVSVRGIEYLVVSLTPDGTGMTRAELMQPGAEEGPRPEWRAWR